MPDTLTLTYDDLTEACTADGCEKGTVASRAWAEWHQRERAARDAWYAAHPDGFWYGSQEYSALEPDEPGEEEEWPCRKCHGTGRAPNETGRAILRLVRDHGPQS